MDIEYIKEGDYLIPNLILGVDPEENAKSLGKYGLMRESYLRNHRSGTFNTMLMKNTLKKHLFEVDRAARERMGILIDGLLEENPAPDKAKDQMAWVRHMNNLKHIAEEVILKELVYI
jgi:hypothetical protein